MENNFNLRKFLTENKLTSSAKILNELELENEFTFADIFNSADTGDATLEDEEKIIAPAMEYLQVKSAKDMVLVASGNDGKWYRPGDFNVKSCPLVRMGYTTVGELKRRPVVGFHDDSDEMFIYAKK